MAYTTIDDPEAYFQTVIYTGDGSADHAITLPGDTDMQPDVVWIKNRDATDSHCFFDSVRGATKVMHVELEAAETTDADTLDSFTSDGFQVDADVKVNTNTEDYVAWCWKESATSGFDIVQYTGPGGIANISHSLSAVPHVFIVKCQDASKPWSVYHHKNTAAPETDKLSLHTTDATLDIVNYWNDTAPTSSVFTIGATNDVMEDGKVFMTYLWSEKQGFSKFGGYTGNGNADGTFVYTGFRPAFVMTKQTDGTDWWVINDTKRNTYNPTDLGVYPNGNNAETSDEAWTKDILSNGFKHRTTNSGSNGSGNTYIYMAFAEAPFVNSNGVPCNAR